MSPKNKKDVSATSPNDWLIHAQSDLKLAKLGLSHDVLAEQVCFHAQQSVEKSLKAVLLYYRIDFPLTHDLEQLLDTLEQGGIKVPPGLLAVGELTPYAVETRYPGYWGEISEYDVENAIALAEETISWAGRVVQEAGEGSG